MKNYTFLIIVLVFGLFFNFQLFSQIPILKVDINEDSRKESEVNNPGYYPWSVENIPASYSVEGITFSLKNGTGISSWYKTAVQAPFYAQLANDCILTEDVELHISGLQNGKHSLVTFHNTVGNPDNNIFSTINIYVNDVKVIDSLQPSNRVLSNDSCATAYMEFEVTNSDTVVIRFQSAPKTSTTSFGIPICGFHLNSSDPKKIARFQYPADMDEHVNIDNDTLIFYWTSPPNTVSHNIYLGTNKLEVVTADTSSPHFIGNIADTFYVKTGFYSMDSYYWRVDPINSEGDTTKGDVWYFKKRMLAFPGAEGYGRYAIGGRYGKIVYVTNLNDDGPGSFREAVTSGIGPRTVIFNVSGIISLNSKIFCDDNITIAGQTAPGKGICLRKSSLAISSESICRFMRMRLGSGESTDGMGMPGASESIMDHCSVSWSIDEGVTSRNAKNITIQKTIISEALNMANLHGDASNRHGFAAVFGGDIASVHHNLLAHNSGRNPRFDGGMNGNGYYMGRVDYFNNVVYNWNAHAAYGEAHEVNFVNNYYKQGPATGGTTIFNADVNMRESNKGTETYYVSGNVLELKSGNFLCDGSENNCGIISSIHGSMVIDWDIFVNKPLFPSEVEIESANDAYKHVLSDAGCTLPVFDDHDKRMIKETMNGTYAYSGSKTGLPGIIDSEKDAGGWEEYPGFLRSVNWDTDSDGLPNWWEKAHGLDTISTEGDFSESYADNDNNAYTNLEEYLHWMAKPHYFIGKDENIKIDLSDYTKGFTNTPVYAISDILNGTFTLDSSIVNFIPTNEGLAQFSFTVTDADSTSMTKKIGIYIGYIPPDSAFSYTYLDEPTDTNATNTGNTNPGDTTTNINNNISISNLNLHPNPANNILNISFKSDANAKYEFVFMDITGNILFKKTIKTYEHTNSANIDLTELSAGIYFLNINNNSFNKTYQFIKK